MVNRNAGDFSPRRWRRLVAPNMAGHAHAGLPDEAFIDRPNKAQHRDSDMAVCKLIEFPWVERPHRCLKRERRYYSRLAEERTVVLLSGLTLVGRTAMPMVNVRLIEGVFTPSQKQEMIR